MTSDRPKNIAITGASAGLGAALAQAYAKPGRNLGLIGRDISRLKETGKLCETQGACVVLGTVDVCDPVSLRNWMTTFDAEHPIDLLIVNAGVFTGHSGDGRLETIEEISWQLRTNLEGAINSVNSILQAMRSRRAGHIAIIGSLAALQPLADAPGYSASKAGIMSYGEALREYLIPDSITISLIYPGHIKTAQITDHVGALPLLITPEKAAKIIKNGLDSGRTFIAFPRRLLWLIRAGRILPWRLRAALGRDFRFSIRKD